MHLAICGGTACEDLTGFGNIRHSQRCRGIVVDLCRSLLAGDRIALFVRQL